MTDRLSDDTASFKVDDAFQITNRNFYLLGFIMSGRVKIGMSVNLTNLGLYKKAVIKDIGLSTSEAIGLGFDSTTFTEEDKKYLKENSPFQSVIIIE